MTEALSQLDIFCMSCSGKVVKFQMILLSFILREIIITKVASIKYKV